MNHPKLDPWEDVLAAFTNDNTCTPHKVMLDNDQAPITPPHELQARFDLGQEVFILDSSGTEPTGLTTYLVLSNHEQDVAGCFLYRLIPSQEVVFRAAEKRLLEVKFALGAQVKRMGDAVCSVVTRRYVVAGARMYDLKDELGKCVKGVNEEALGPGEQRRFPFVTSL